MAKYLDIFTDYGFKKIFGEEASRKILIDFLNSLLPDDTLIKDLTFKNTEQLGVTADDRRAVYDIYCENERGEKFIVELQKAKQDYFKERTIYYSTFPISEQAKKGDWNYDLKAVFCIGLLDFTFKDYNDESEMRDVVHRITLKDQNGKQFYHKLTYIYLEMPNFHKNENELGTRLDKWLYFIKNLEDFQTIPHIFKDEVVFIEAMEKAELSKMSGEERAKYDYSLKIYRDNYSIFETKWNEGKKEGIVIGEENKSRFADEKVKENKIEIAKNCIKNGMSVEMTVKITGLPEEEIREIIK